MTRKPHPGVDLARNGPPPEAAACLYEGKVMHQRMRPFGHRFSYRVFSLLLDLDRLAEAGRLSRLFSVNRRNWMSFHEKDHLDQGETGLAGAARDQFRAAGLATPVRRVLLVCYPRIFGHVFNPLSVYYGYDAAENLAGLIYEVSNTFGGRHRYVCPVGPDETGANGVRQQADKLFHVSPFIAMNMRYHFRMLPPGEEIRWRILETSPEGPLLSATFSGTALALTTPALLALFGRIPFLTVSILAGIHWEALKIWWKGAKFIPTPGKSVPSPDSSQLPKPHFRSRLEGDATFVPPAGDGTGQQLPSQLGR